MRKPRPGGDRGRGGGEISRERQSFTTAARICQASLSPRAIASAAKLARYRAAVTLWDRCHGQTPMPQPEQYGFRLPPIRPSDVAWGDRL